MEKFDAKERRGGSKGSTHAEWLPHILADPLVTHVLALGLGGWVGGWGCVEIEAQVRIVALFHK